MKTLLAAILFMTVLVVAYSQKPPLKFGDVSIDEVKMTHCAADSSAAAVILFDYGVTRLNYTLSINRFILEFDRITRIKILKKEAIH